MANHENGGGGSWSLSRSRQGDAGHSHMAQHYDGVDRHANCPLNNHAGRAAAGALRGVAARVRRAEGCGEAVARVAGLQGSGVADRPAGIVGEELGGGVANANATRNGSGCASGRYLRDAWAGWRARGVSRTNCGGGGGGGGRTGFDPWEANAAAEAAGTGDDGDQAPRFVGENSTPLRRQRYP